MPARRFDHRLCRKIDRTLVKVLMKAKLNHNKAYTSILNVVYHFVFGNEVISSQLLKRNNNPPVLTLGVLKAQDLNKMKGIVGCVEEMLFQYPSRIDDE
ncbi:hypothetical protein ACTXT7_008311 [Hymenolepis weldensis]